MIVKYKIFGNKFSRDKCNIVTMITSSYILLRSSEVNIFN